MTPTLRDVKKDFPFFEKNPGTVFLDSAASSLTPHTVIQAVTKYYEECSVNIHRGVYEASREATEVYENTREVVKKFLKSETRDQVVYLRNATEGFNLLAVSLSQVDSLKNSAYSAWRTGFSPKDVIILSESEHHANIVPWQILAERCSLEIEYIPVRPENGSLNLDAFEEMKNKLQNRCVKIVSLAQASNVTGIVHDLSVFKDYAREKGALFVVDGAQSVCHQKIDLKQMDPDFFIFSGHKMLAPTGIGILWGKDEIMKDLPPFMGGGDMILSVTKSKTVYNALPHKFEAGTPHIAGVFGLRAAIEYLEALEWKELEESERFLTLYAMRRLQETGVTVHGPDLEEVESGDVQKIGVVSFGLDSVHPHDVGSILDQENIAIRVGHHCCQILMHAWSVPATCRASLYLYNDESDIDCLIKGISKIKEIFS